MEQKIFTCECKELNCKMSLYTYEDSNFYFLQDGSGMVTVEHASHNIADLVRQMEKELNIRIDSLVNNPISEEIDELRKIQIQYLQDIVNNITIYAKKTA